MSIDKTTIFPLEKYYTLKKDCTEIMPRTILRE